MANADGGQTRMVEKKGGKETRQGAHQHQTEEWTSGLTVVRGCGCTTTGHPGAAVHPGAGTRSAVRTHRFFFSFSSSSPAAPAPPLLDAALPPFLLLLTVLFLRAGGAANVVAVAVAVVADVPEDIASLVVGSVRCPSPPASPVLCAVRSESRMATPSRKMHAVRSMRGLMLLRVAGGRALGDPGADTVLIDRDRPTLP